MYDNTFLIFSSDNGGPIAGGANNYPMRGGKFSNWEGGIRVAAFVSGGVVPAARRTVRVFGQQFALRGCH
jgi:arylsulfatase I/J